MTIVLGIDPGSKFTGYGLVAKEGTKLRLVAAGRIATKASAPLSDRLGQVFSGLEGVLQQYSPDVVSVEDIFYAKNLRSALRLGHVRGVAFLAGGPGRSGSL